MGCVDLPELPLQILLRERPAWRAGPVAVLANDRSDAPLVHVNAIARRAGLVVGMRHGAARDRVPALRAAAVTAGQVIIAVEDLVVALQTFSPRVEPDPEQPGVFFVDPEGLGQLYGGPRNWATSVHRYLDGRGFRSAVVIGFGRFSTFAVARGRSGPLVVPSAHRTRELAEQVPLEALGITAELRDALGLLDVRTIGDLAGLPGDAVRARFGEEAAHLHALSSDDPQLPMQARAQDEPVRVELALEPPDDDLARLLFGIKGGLHEMARALAARQEVLSALRLELSLEGSEPVVERVEPAAPTRDVVLLVDLVRLRLGDTRLCAPVTAVTLVAESARATGEQLVMWREPERDLRAGERALARVRAAFGPRSVTKACLEDAHLPEAAFSYEPVGNLARPVRSRDPATPNTPPLVRRVLPRPRPIAARSGSDPASGPALEGAPLRLFGPYRVSGGWWRRTVERDYYYAESGGELLWLYYDRPRSQWFLHGIVD